MKIMTLNNVIGFPAQSHVRTGLYLFSNDLRIHANKALELAIKSVDELIFLYVVDPRWLSTNHYGLASLGEHRQRFLSETLFDLRLNLKKHGQELFVVEGRAVEIISKVSEFGQIDEVFSSVHAGWYEYLTWKDLKAQFPEITFTHRHTHTLFSPDTLPFDLDALPATFSKFRKKIEASKTKPDNTGTGKNPLETALPPPPTSSALRDYLSSLACARLDDAQRTTAESRASFRGGETQALKHLDCYFSSKHPLSYKQTRNALSGWQNSGKFSPWLANGSVSPAMLAARIADYEQEHGANDSTYWLYFELLWREYFQWYSHAHGSRLYLFRGLAKSNPLTSYYPERFKKWINGNTPFKLVNACMNELMQTGFLSNRSRQIVASCFVNELALDWRYGAAYFQQVLIDHDVGSNWGNWQYISGVGADPRGGRHFNIEKQQQLCDPDESYIRRWYGSDVKASPLDSVDIVDWPIS